MLTVFYLTIQMSAPYKWLQISGDDTQQKLIRKTFIIFF